MDMTDAKAWRGMEPFLESQLEVQSSSAGQRLPSSSASSVGDAEAPQVYLLETARGRMKNNNYLVVDPVTHQAVAIDPAWQPEVFAEALAATRATLSEILVTHTHDDHIDLAVPLSEHYNCPIRMSREEIAWSGFDATRLLPLDGTPWQVGAMTIEPILTPGHTPGCVCYRIGDNLFTGDVLFAEGCGICFELDAAHRMFDSLQDLKQRLAPHTHVFPGHTYVRPPGQRFSELMRCNIYLQFSDRESFATYRLRRGQQGGKVLDFR